MARTTALLAPEDLVGVHQARSGAWRFVGASGTTYEAMDPLGAFTSSLGPPEPLERIASGGGVTLATTWSGRLVRWDEPGGFREVGLAARIFDVAVSASGQVLALAFPETLYASADRGQTFVQLAVPTMGARRVGVVASGALGVAGVLGNARLTDREPSLVATSEPVTADLPGGFRVGRFANARAIRSGRAMLHGSRYHELSRGEDADDSDEDWQLSRGSWDAPLETIPLTGTGQCRSMHMGARGRTLFVACVHQEGDQIRVDLRRSTDDGGHFDAELALASVGTGAIAMAVSPRGSLLMTGVCPPSGRKLCEPTSPVLVSMVGGALRARPVGAPEVADVALAPAFSEDGQSAYFLGHRGKDQRLSLFVSHDAGQSFSERALPAAARSAAAIGSGDQDEGEWDGDGPPELAPAGGSAVVPGDDGVVGILMTQGDPDQGAAVYITTDEDGRSVRTSRAPTEGGVLGGFGRRTMALVFGSDEPMSWESLNGGQAWAPIAAPPVLTRIEEGEPIACSAMGCLVGAALVRVGWGAQVDAPVPRPPEEEARGARRDTLAAPIVCELARGEAWTAVEHVVSTSDASQFGEPALRDLGRGRSLWSVASLDRSKGSLRVISAVLDGKSARVRTDPLLAGAGREGEISLWSQVEGYAATRVGEARVGARIRGLEVAWVDFMTDKLGHVVLGDVGVMEGEDLQAARKDGVTFSPRLLSVSLGGVFVRPHHVSAETFFIDPHGTTTRLEYPSWPSALGAPPSEDAAMVEGRFLAVAMPKGDPAAVVLSAVAPRTVHVAALGPSEAAEPTQRRTLVGWTSAGGASVGRSILHSNLERAEAWGHFQAFRPDGTLGEPVPIPTPLDLPVAPRPCSAADRATPRVVAPDVSAGAPAFLGARHLVRIVERSSQGAEALGEPLAMTTSGTVLHGTPTAPCVAAWKAERIGASDYAAVLSGDLVHAYLFRPRKGAASGATALELRAMSCGYEGRVAPPSDPARPSPMSSAVH
jgi:hypothetical protein